MKRKAQIKTKVDLPETFGELKVGGFVEIPFAMAFETKVRKAASDFNAKNSARLTTSTDAKKLVTIVTRLS